MTLRIFMDGAQAGQKLEHGLLIAQQRITRTVATTASEASGEVLRRGRADIASAGRFGRRWHVGLHADVRQEQVGTSISVFHDVQYFSVFETGKTIRGKPLLWIPLSFARDAQGVLARNYPGGLFRVDRTGKASLLLSRSTKEPKYFAKESVVIPKKFHIREIARDVANKLRAIYSKHFQKEVGGA